MLYRSLITLLLAFFISMATMGSQAGMPPGHKGMGSMIGGVQTFGGGGVFEHGGGKVLHGQPGPSYKASEGQEQPPTTRRIDPELEDAQLAMQALQDQFDVRTPLNAAGYRVELPTPCTYWRGKAALTPEEEQFLMGLALPLERVVLSKGFVVRLGVALPPGEAEESGGMTEALAAADRVRTALIGHMSASARSVAERRTYCFLRPQAAGRMQAPRAPAPAAGPTGQVDVTILLTKPYVRQIMKEGAGKSENDTAN